MGKSIVYLWRFPVTTVGWITASIVLAAFAPYGTADSGPFAIRLLYWLAVFASSLVLAGVLRGFSVRMTDFFGVLGMRLAAAGLFSVLFVPIVYSLDLLFFPERCEDLMGYPQMMALLFVVFASIGLVIDAVYYQFTGIVCGVRPKKVAVPETCETARQALNDKPRFLTRLGSDLGTDLIRLSMQDHYVEAHTTLGSKLILLRLSDAIEELGGIPGLRVHRSHWVALDGVVEFEKDNGRVYLMTKDGGRVPVSRSHRDAVRDAGLLG